MIDHYGRHEIESDRRKENILQKAKDKADDPRHRVSSETKAMDNHVRQQLEKKTSLAGVPSSVGLPGSVRFTAEPITHNAILEIHSPSLSSKILRLLKDPDFEQLEEGEPFFLLRASYSSSLRALDAWIQDRQLHHNSDRAGEVEIIAGLFKEYYKTRSRSDEVRAKIKELEAELAKLQGQL